MSTPDMNIVPRLILIGVAIIVLVILVTQYNKNKGVIKEESRRSLERYAEPMRKPSAMLTSDDINMSSKTPNSGNNADANAVMPSEAHSNEDFKAVDFTQAKPDNTDSCFPRDTLTPEDLLPKDAANSKWAQANPAGQGDVKDQNFLTAGFHIGVNTIGQTMRNPNYQLRSEPSNPKMNLSPWNQSTIEYDDSRRFFEIGSC